MSINVSLTEFVKAHASPPAGMKFYHSCESVKSDARLLGYVSAIERAWSEMGLNGVLCLDGRPVLYLIEHDKPFSAFKRIQLQRLFWNQGIANALVLADPQTVYIYSGLAKPISEKTSLQENEDALIKIFKQVDYIAQIQTFYHRLATGHFYEEYPDKFGPQETVDSYLLDNLRALRNTLIEGEEGLDKRAAHAFIGRVLFLCYLLDRDIYSVGKARTGQTGTLVLAEKLGNLANSDCVNYLYDKIFSDLKEQFNGNMFDQDLEVEKNIIRSVHLDNLVQFLGGHKVADGQRTLGFWAYDFKMIPVETISEIYQDFLATEDPQKQKKRGAIYTPRFLAEMVVDIAMQDNSDALKWSYLDPSCGSGIFLVIIFNRLAMHWVLSKPTSIYKTKATALQNILKCQIRGVDIEETACRITCFSLYLAYLDFFTPRDLNSHEEKTGKPLFKLLDYGDTPDRPVADMPVIYKANSLEENTLSDEKFDCIIGNPPWVGRGKKQDAQKFMVEAKRLLTSNGIGCMLLPSKILQNQTDLFQADWLKTVTLDKVLQLADYRHHLFSGAKTPAFIARFNNKTPDLLTQKVEFIAPKFNREGLRQGIITVSPSTRTWIPLTDILSAAKTNSAPVVWKRHLWGTPRDQKLLDYLIALPPLSSLADEPKEGKRWVKGEGLQPYYPDKTGRPTQNPWSLDTAFADAKAPHAMLLLQSDCITLGERLSGVTASIKELRRSPNKKLFKAPLVLVSQGFGKVAFCDFDVLFQDSLQSIAGPKEDSELLMFLAAYLRSKLAKYFLFHTAANWGSERDKVHLHELLRVPFPLPGDESASKEAGKIVKQVANKLRALRDKLIAADGKSKQNEFKLRGDDGVTERKKLVDNLQKEMEPLIYKYFGLTKQEIILVEDTMDVFEPSSTPSNWRSRDSVTLDPMERTKVEHYANQGLKAYADTLTDTLNEWAKIEGSGYRVGAEGGIDNETGLAMVTLSLVDEEVEYQQKKIRRNLASVLRNFKSRVSQKQGVLLYERDLLVFKGNRIYIIRPNILLNWTRTAALNDAATIYGDIVLSR